MKSNINVEEAEEQNCCSKNHKGIFGGIILITVGIIFLLNNFGLLPWSVWSILWRFWPLFLILGGLEILLGNNWFARFIFSLLTLITVGFILFQIVAVNNSSFSEWLHKQFPWMPINTQIFKLKEPQLRNDFFNDGNTF